MSLRRWDLAWASLDPAQGHEQAGRRPVLIFCNDSISAAIGLVAVLPLTTWRKGRRVYPTEVLLKADTAGLAADSLVLCHQLRTVSAERLSPAFAHLADPASQAAVDRAVRLWLDLQTATQ
ncbi:MAG: type II toxin-antitoxin system PemK/MazF family toxin [Acidobacteria bacterium]|nr:type II toxin-antitoxin system PemK/MazF family toxin [Acidobacteriota bacterium]